MARAGRGLHVVLHEKARSVRKACLSDTGQESQLSGGSGTAGLDDLETKRD